MTVLPRALNRQVPDEACTTLLTRIRSLTSHPIPFPVISNMSNETDQIGTVDYNGNDYDSSLYDPTITFSNDKYFCLKSMFVAHIVFNWLVFISGIICLISRVIPIKYRWIHAWSGRLYIISMLWTTAVSTAMTNTGLPLPTLISFAAILIGLSIGWIAIVLYKNQVDSAARQVLSERLRQEQLQSKQPTTTGDNSNTDTEKDPAFPSLDVMWDESKMQALESRTFRQRFVSWKTLHGVLFFVGWMQITGRMVRIIYHLLLYRHSYHRVAHCIVAARCISLHPIRALRNLRVIPIPCTNPSTLVKEALLVRRKD